MRRRHHLALIAMASALLTVACADDTPADDADGTSSADATTSSDATTTAPSDSTTTTSPDIPGGGDFLIESTDPTQEFRDCLTGCTHDGPPFNFNYSSGQAILGTIDGNCHELAGDKVGKDIDVIGLTASARTLLEITVDPGQGSPLEPVITTLDGTSAMTYSQTNAAGGVGARSVIAAPFLNSLPFYVVVEHFPNYDALAGDPTCEQLAGGPEYTYELRVREIPFEPVELGMLDAGGSATASGTLPQHGDIQYFRFEAPATSSPTVTITGTGGGIQPSAAGMSTIEGQLVWNQLQFGGSTVTLSGSEFDTCFSDCDGVTGEFIFAVLDYNGFGGADYTFDVAVQL